MLRVKTIGDPHLGRTFTNGVPLHRRGEREANVEGHFIIELLNAEGYDLCVCMGDLFDSIRVDNSTLKFAIDAYIKAAEKNPDTKYFILRGNHDGSRDVDVVSSFELFAQALRLAARPNITVVDDRPVEIDGHLFVPWHPFKTSEEMLEGLTGPYECVYGHWEIQSYGGDDHMLLPYEKLAQITKKVVTGHVHQPQTFERDGLEVVVTGSMQPYSHAEDLTGERYMTLTLEELENIKVDLRDKCVRLLLRDGEDMPEVPDCLQFTVKRVTSDEVKVEEVELGNFDLKKIYDEVMQEFGVTEQMATKVWEKVRAAQS